MTDKIDVKRYQPNSEYEPADVWMAADAEGDWVEYVSYFTLSARLAEVEMERDDCMGGLETALDQRDVADARAEAAEAKLAQAVEALRSIASEKMIEGGCYYTNRVNIMRARATLAQIGGDA